MDLKNEKKVARKKGGLGNRLTCPHVVEKMNCWAKREKNT